MAKTTKTTKTKSSRRFTRATLLEASLYGAFANCFGVRISHRTGVVWFRDSAAREKFEEIFARYENR